MSFASNRSTTTTPLTPSAPCHHYGKSVDAEAISEILEVMKTKEQIYKRLSITNDLHLLWRRMLLEWMFFVVDYCKLSRSTCSHGAFFLDWSVATGLCTTRESFQLVAATVLNLSLKSVGTAVIKVDKLVSLGRGLFTSEDIFNMEIKIIDSLKWHLHPITAYDYMLQFERLLPSGITDEAKEKMDEVTRVLAELTILEDQYLTCDASVLAYSTILLSLEMTKELIPVHLRQCFLVRMSAVANLDSSSQAVLECFDRIRESIQSSNKVLQMSDTAAATGALDRCSLSSNSSSHDKRFTAGIHYSPRDVKVKIGRDGRFGSFSSFSTSPMSL